MDLEVSEPIDFSSGDHQHLVRKAADPYTGGKSARSYGTAPSTQEPRQAHGNPHSRADRRADTYVVQISPETTTDDNNPGPFSETAVRRGRLYDLGWSRILGSLTHSCRPFLLYLLYSPAVGISAARCLRITFSWDCFSSRFAARNRVSLLSRRGSVMGNSSDCSGDAITQSICSSNKMGFHFAKRNAVCFTLRTYHLWNYLNLHSSILVASIVCWTWNCDLLTLLGDGCAADGGRAPSSF